MMGKAPMNRELPMASLSDRFNAGTSVFTVIAAITAAVSAFYSYRQMDLTWENQIRAERLAAFDKFTDTASEVCNMFVFPALDYVWHSKADDFKAAFDLTPHRE